MGVLLGRRFEERVLLTSRLIEVEEEPWVSGGVLSCRVCGVMCLLLDRQAGRRPDEGPRPRLRCESRVSAAARATGGTSTIM